jgi:hypothetical protein
MVACSVGAACGLSSTGSGGAVADGDGGSDDGTTSTETSDASSGDGAVDASIGNDAPSDAGSSPDADAGAASFDATTFCAAIDATFCADFDDPDGGPTFRWDTAVAPDGSTIAFDLAHESSPPRSLHAITSNGTQAGASKTFTVGTKFTVDYDFLLLFLPDSGDFSPLQIRANTGDHVFQFNGPDGATNSYFQVGGAEYSPHFASPSLGVWHHVQVQVDLGAAGTTLNAYLDGTLRWQNHALTLTWTTPAQVTLVLGAGSLFQLSYGEAFIDNVVVQAY